MAQCLHLVPRYEVICIKEGDGSLMSDSLVEKTRTAGGGPSSILKLRTHLLHGGFEQLFAFPRRIT
ncbi:hypothetical protein ABMB68_004532 [Bradyrhizobium sp. RT4a]